MIEMKHNLSDLNGYLFEQLERLNESESKGDELKEEIERSKAISGVANNVLKTAELVLEGQKLMSDKMDADQKLPKMLE